MPLQALLIAWIYARRSRVSENQASTTDQKDHGLAVIADRGWQLGEILDEEVSASRYARKAREAWPLLLEAVEAGKVGVLILWEASRGDRTLATWAAFLELCQAKGVLIHIISHERTYDPRNARDWKTLATEGVDSDHYARRQSVDIKRGKAGAARRGRPQGAPAYGYRVRYDERTGQAAGWDIVPGRADVVRRIKRGIGKHVPGREIMRQLNAEGIPSPTGGEWTPEAVRYIAANPSYAGLVRLPDGTLGERDAAWPAIVTREVHDAAAAVLAPRAGTRPGAAVHLLTYLARCDCGGTLRWAGDASYKCEHGHNYISAPWLDERVAYLVCAKLARGDARDLYADDSDDRAAALKAELGPLTERRKRYIARAADGDPDADEILAALKPRIARLERQLGEIRYVPALRGILTADDTFAAWQGYTVQARREIITAVTGITVLRVPRSATAAERYDVARIVPDWVPQPPRVPGNRRGRKVI